MVVILYILDSNIVYCKVRDSSRSDPKQGNIIKISKKKKGCDRTNFSV